MNGFQKRTDKKKKDIIDVAVKLFEKYPPNKVKIRDIASKASVSTFTIYNYFKNKEGLVFEIIKNIVSHQVECLSEIKDSENSFPEKIRRIVLLQNQVLYKFHPDFMNYFISESDIDEYLTETYQVKLKEILLSVINQGKQEGYVDPQLPNSLIISIFQLFNNDLASENSLILANHQIADIQAKILEIIIYGISGKTDK